MRTRDDVRFHLAADNAMFGQPEIKLGIIPGMGGSQRLTRFIGKARATEMCLTGRMMDAQEAERCGLVSRIVPKDNLLDEALKVADAIGGMSLPSVLTLKEVMNRAFEVPLAKGVRSERRLFHSLFATADQKEGMVAFLEKRPTRQPSTISAPSACAVPGSFLPAEAPPAARVPRRSAARHTSLPKSPS
jgi:enoyl-CoA hydratase